MTDIDIKDVIDLHDLREDRPEADNKLYGKDKEKSKKSKKQVKWNNLMEEEKKFYDVWGENGAYN